MRISSIGAVWDVVTVKLSFLTVFNSLNFVVPEMTEILKLAFNHLLIVKHQDIEPCNRTEYRATDNLYQRLCGCYGIKPFF